MANDIQQIGEALSTTFWNGAGYVEPLDWPEIPAVLDWAQTQSFRPAAEHYGRANVEQRFSNADYDPEDFVGPLEALVERLCQSVKQARGLGIYPAAEALCVWRPDLVVAQRYQDGLGIGWHIDESANSHLLTAIFNLEGKALFHVEPDPDRYIWPAVWPAAPGSLILLRGNELMHWVDREGWIHNVQPHGRPRHMVDECTDDRLSLILRMRPPAVQ